MVFYVSAVYLAKEDWVSAEKDATKCVELNDVFVKGVCVCASSNGWHLKQYVALLLLPTANVCSSIFPLKHLSFNGVHP